MIQATPRFSIMDLWMFVLMLIWGTNYVILKSAVDVLPPMVFNSFRFATAAVVMGLLFKANGYKLTLPRREWPIIFGQGALPTRLSDWTEAYNGCQQQLNSDHHAGVGRAVQHTAGP